MQNIFQVQALCGRHTPKIHTKLTKKFIFLQILHLSSNLRVCNLTLYFQFTTPARELTHRMKFEYPGRPNFGHAMFLCYLEPEKCQKTYPENNTNFGHAMFLRYLDQRNAKNLPRKQHKFQQRPNSSLPRASKMPQNQPKDTNFVPNCTH